MATISNLFIDQGTTFSVKVDVTDDDGSPFNLTGYTIIGQIRKSYYSATKIDFITSIQGPGEIEISLDETVTGVIKSGRYVYDVIISNSQTSTTLRVVEGILTINPGVSR